MTISNAYARYGGTWSASQADGQSNQAGRGSGPRVVAMNSLEVRCPRLGRGMEAAGRPRSNWHGKQRSEAGYAPAVIGRRGAEVPEPGRLAGKSQPSPVMRL